MVKWKVNPDTCELDLVDSSGSGGGGDVSGPGSSTDNAIVRWDGTTGTLIQDSNTLITDGGQVQTIDGQASTPVYSFASSTNSGIYFSDPAISFSSNATLTFATADIFSQFYTSLGVGTTSGNAVINETTTTLPAYSFFGDTNTGLGWVSADSLELVTGGSNALTIDSSQIVTLANPLGETSGGTGTATYTLGDVLYSDASDSLDKLPIGTDGQVLTVSSGLPSWQDNAGGDVSGPASSTDNAVTRWDGVSGELIQDSNSILTDAGQYQSVSGSTSNPTYGFTSATSSGIANLSGTNVDIIANGNQTLSIESGIIRAYESIRAGTSNGEAFIQVDNNPTRPAYAFAGDIDTGLQWNSADDLSLFTDGTDALNIDSSQVVTLANALLETSGGTGESSYTDGQLLIGNSLDNGLDKATLTAGSGVSIVNGNGSVTISASGGGYSWIEVTGTSDDLDPSTGFIANNAGLVTLTLPATCSVGDTFRVVGKGTGGWSIAQNAGQTIHFSGSDTTTGATGSLDSTGQYDCVELLCTTTDTDFTVISSIGVIGVT